MTYKRCPTCRNVLTVMADSHGYLIVNEDGSVDESSFESEWGYTITSDPYCDGCDCDDTDEADQ